jgi:hypothetical protein
MCTAELEQISARVSGRKQAICVVLINITQQQRMFKKQKVTQQRK